METDLMDNNTATKTIAACLIVKNEEASLAKCLNSLKDAVDEIVVVDTGSDDRTVDIARQFTDRVFYFKWNNSFADARNCCIEHCSSDWILVLDADEEFKGNRESLMRLVSVEAHKHICYMVKIINRLEKGEEATHFMARLFPRSDRIRWHGIIHEDIESIDGNLLQVMTDKIHIIHYGYGKHVNNMDTKKLVRNETMLEEAVRSGDNKVHYLFHSAITASAAGKVRQAEDLFEKWFREALKSKANLSMGLSAYMSLLISDNRHKAALKKVEPFIQQCENSADFCLNLGIIYESMQDDEKAIKYLQKAKTANIFNTVYTDSHSAGWKPRAVLGNIFIRSGEFSKAITEWEEAVNMAPESADIREALARLYFNEKNIERTREHLEILFESYPAKKTDENMVIYANILFNEGETARAARIFKGLKDGEKYIDQIIAGCISANRLEDVKIITAALEE